MGGRGANSYIGRFSSGTEEQLRIAKNNLESYIARLEQTVKSQTEANKINPGMFEERLKMNKESLKGVEQQYKELQKEYKKRKIAFKKG